MTRSSACLSRAAATEAPVIAGTYVLILCCDHRAGHPTFPRIEADGISMFPVMITATKVSEARRKARKAGWLLGRPGKPDLCPKCARTLLRGRARSRACPGG